MNHGYHHSALTKEKIRQKAIGRKPSDATREKLRRSHLGIKMSDLTKEKIRQATIGKKRSDATKEKIRQVSLGRKLSDKHKEAIRKAQIGRVRSLKERMDHSDSQKGDKHWNWKGGITATNRLLRHSIEYKLWREAVFKRDKWTCVWCGHHGGRIEADHIQPFFTNPELRFAVDNGRTLCHSCHIKRHSN